MKRIEERFFDSFQQKPDKEEQKEIRKIFVRLAARFHPDKAQSEKEAENLHELMQQINQAYQRGDIAELLQLEKKYANVDLKEESALGRNCTDELGGREIGENAEGKGDAGKPTPTSKNRKPNS